MSAPTLPRSTRQVGAWIEQEFCLVYESRSGLIALLHRLGLDYHKPDVIARKLDEKKQAAFIENYEKLLNSFGNDEAVLFADAHASDPCGAACRLLGAQAGEALERRRGASGSISTARSTSLPGRPG